MKIHFYSNIIDLEPIYKDLILLELEEHEYKELILIAETTVYHAVINIILTELNKEDKKVFLKLLDKNDHNGIWEHLGKNITNIKDLIQKEVSLVIKELRKDIHATDNKL